MSQNDRHDVGTDPVDYHYEMSVASTADRIVDAVTDPTEIMRWWTAVDAADAEGDLVRLVMGGQSLTMTVDRPSEAVVEWTVQTCEMAPDWVGTRPTFAVTGTDGNVELEFRHVGLVPTLECFDMCRAGWGHFLPSLHAYLETGAGLPNEPRLVTT